MSLDKSSSTFPVLIPCSSLCLEISANFSDEFNKALEGIQPIFKQVPPSVCSFSTHATFMPSCAALIAATYPPGPAPITIKSKSAIYTPKINFDGFSRRFFILTKNPTLSFPSMIR